MVFDQDINFWGNVYPTLVALPYLHQTNGRVIINASVENWLPLPRMSLYGVSIYASHLIFSVLLITIVEFRRSIYKWLKLFRHGHRTQYKCRN